MLTYEAVVVALQKKKTLLKYYFCTLFLYCQDFYQVWKIAGQISRLFQEFKTLFQPWAQCSKMHL